jgi:hypothetical protein
MAISVVVLLATLTTLDTFSSNASRQTRVTDANDQVRAAMDRVVADLRQAATIEVASPNDLVYTVIDTANKTRRERICLDTSSKLWRASVRTPAPPMVPIAPGTPCPTPGSGAAQITKLTSVNSAANPMFRYDSATPSNVRSVGLTISLDAGNGGRTDTSTLRASTFVRSKAETASAVDENDVETTCAGGQPTLTLASSVGPLTVTYTDIDGHALGSASAGSSLLLTGVSGTIVANITSSVGLVSQIVKVLGC